MWNGLEISAKLRDGVGKPICRRAILADAEGVIELAKRFTKSLWTDRISDMKSRLLTVRDEAD